MQAALNNPVLADLHAARKARLARMSKVPAEVRNPPEPARPQVTVEELAASVAELSAKVRQLEADRATALRVASATDMLRELYSQISGSDGTTEGDEFPIRVATVREVVAAFYEISVIDLISERRTRALTRPRQIAFYLCREMTTSSLPQIGKMFGGRDHTTGLAAYRKIEAELRHDEVLQREVAELRLLVKARQKLVSGQVLAAGMELRATQPATV